MLPYMPTHHVTAVIQKVIVSILANAHKLRFHCCMRVDQDVVKSFFFKFKISIIIWFPFL